MARSYSGYYAEQVIGRQELRMRRFLHRLNQPSERIPNWAYGLAGVLFAQVPLTFTGEFLDGWWAVIWMGSILAVMTVFIGIHVVREWKAIRAAHRRGERRSVAAHLRADRWK
jgi:hypothetical protein